MDRDEINQKLFELENQIRKSYTNASILDSICTLEGVPEKIGYGTYRQFANKFKIDRNHITDPTHFLILDELGSSVARSEIKTLLHSFDEGETKEVDTFSIEKIREYVYNMKSNGQSPNAIFVPIEYFHDIHDWNRDNKPLDTPGSRFDVLYLDTQTSLQVKYSNKIIPFENVIITSQDSNHWKYRPDTETKGRITVKFDWDDGDNENAILLVKTTFKLDVKNEGNLVLKIKDFVKKS